MSAKLQPLLTTKNTNVIRPGPWLSVYSTEKGHCAIDAGWLEGDGQRKILRLPIWIQNVGDDAYVGPSLVEQPDHFITSDCFGRTIALKDFLHVRLQKPDGTAVKEWRRGLYRLFDDETLRADAGPPRFAYPTFGLSPGWQCHILSAHPITQFDVTDVASGDYLLSVRTDPDRFHSQTDPGSTVIVIRINDTDLSVVEDSGPGDPNVVSAIAEAQNLFKRGSEYISRGQQIIANLK